MNGPQTTPGKDMLRLLRFLQRRGPARMETAAGKIRLLTDAAALAVEEAAIAACVAARLVSDRDGKLALLPAGAARLKEGLFPDPDNAGSAPALQKAGFNEAESPIARLFFRKDRNGAGWLDAEQFEAGERLRRDFERGRLQPRISANWDASVGGRGRGAGGQAELSDFALDCRRRVDAAIAALEPALAGVALDVCCFLKGLEQVERERQWPPRSAKLMLRTALSSLARHYGLRSGTTRAAIRHWGEADYRPSLPAREERSGPPA